MVERIKVHGEVLTMVEAAKKYNLVDTTIYTRYRRGVRGDGLVRPKQKYRKKYHTEVKDETGKEIIYMEDLTKYSGIKYTTLCRRYIKGWRGEKLISKPRKSDYPTGVYDPETHEEITSLPELTKRYNIAAATLYRRYFDFGMRGEDLVSPVKHRLEQHTEVYDIDINELELADLASLSGIQLNTLWTRYTRGSRGENLLRDKYKRK